MSNTDNTQVKFYGVFYLHPQTGKRCGIGRTYTTESAAKRACASRNKAWSNLSHFYAEVPA